MEWFDTQLYGAGIFITITYYLIGWSCGLVFDLIRRS